MVTVLIQLWPNIQLQGEKGSKQNNLQLYNPVGILQSN